MSRETKLTSEVQAEIVKLVEAGDRPPVAAGACGVGRQTYYDWMRRGVTGEEPYHSFRTAIARARDLCQSNLRKTALNGDDPGFTWGPSKAAFEALGRMFPAEWAPKIKHEISESQRHCFEALSRVCNNPSIIERVCETKDLGVVFEEFCEELARLDGEGDAGAETSEEHRSAENSLH